MSETSAPPMEAAPPKLGPKPPSVSRSPTWWDQSQSSDPNALILQYAGGMKGSSGTGISLVFKGRFDASADFSGHVSVKDAQGQAVPGDWKLAARAGVVYLLVPPGRYRVAITEGLKDADGKTLQHKASGTVTVNE
jgi:hypothetical protein